MISTAYRCLLLRPILIVSGAFGQTRRKGGGNRGTGGREGEGFFFLKDKRGQWRGRGGGVGDISICARKL